MEIYLTQQQYEEYKETMYNNGTVSLFIDGKKAYSFSIEETKNTSNLPKLKGKKTVQHNIKKHDVFDSHIKSLYKDFHNL